MKKTQIPRLISAAETRRILGGISAMSLWRWVRNPNLAFPQPVTINRRRYWDAELLVDWLAGRQAPKAAGGDRG